MVSHGFAHDNPFDVNSHRFTYPETTRAIRKVNPVLAVKKQVTTEKLIIQKKNMYTLKLLLNIVTAVI
jgi:hypothetical protein